MQNEADMVRNIREQTFLTAEELMEKHPIVNTHLWKEASRM